VITTRSTETPQLFQDGRNMLLIPFGDVQALAGAVRKLTRDPAMRSTLARNAGQLYEAFTWDNLTRITIERYSRLVGASR
jgi:glycogen(starch) synthase